MPHVPGHIETARFPRVRNLGLRDPLRDPETPAVTPQAGLAGSARELQRNLPGLVPAFRRTFLPAGPEDLGVLNLPAAALDIAQSGALQQPLISTPGIEAARVESGRVAEAVGAPRLFNQLQPDVEPLISLDPARVARAGGDIAERVAGIPPTGPIPSAPVDVGFEEFARAQQGIRPGGQGAPVIEGPRLIRRPGQTPLLTNLTGPALESGLADERSFVRGETTGRTIVLDPATGEIEGRSPFEETAAPAAGGLRSRVAAPGAGGLQRLEGTVRTIGRPRVSTGRGFLAPATAAGFEQARSTAAVRAQEREFEQDVATQELGLRGREVGARERTAAASEVTAAANLRKALTKAETDQKVGFELTASRPDPQSLDPSNPSFLPATVKVGDTEFNISPEEEQAISTRTREMLRLITADPTTAGVSEEEAFNKALRTATLDIIGDRLPQGQ